MVRGLTSMALSLSLPGAARTAALRRLPGAAQISTGKVHNGRYGLMADK